MTLPTLFRQISTLIGMPALLLAAAAAAVIVVVRDWRAVLAAFGLLTVMLALLLSQVVPTEWALLHAIVGGLVGVMLYLSARQLRWRPGSSLTWEMRWPRLASLGSFRFLTLILAGMAFYAAGDWIQLPVVSPLFRDAIVWLGLMGLLGLALHEEPLHAGLALLTLLGGWELLLMSLIQRQMLLGLLEGGQLLLGLAISYLVLSRARGSGSRTHTGSTEEAGMIPGPGLLFAALIVAALALYFLRRLEPVAALLASAVALVLAIALWQLPLAPAVRLAGRPVLMGQTVTWGDLSLQITPAVRALLVLLFGSGALAFVLAWRTYQGRTFYPLGLVLLASWSAVALLQPITLAPCAAVLASIVSVFLIQAGKAGETRRAWRQLLFPTLSVPLFVLASWYIDQAPLNPDDQTPLRIAGWLIIAGFILLLQPAPLHVATPAVAGQAPPVVAAFLWIGGQAATLFLLQRFLVTYPWLATAVDSARWFLWLGVLTAVVGGAMTATQDSLGRLIGYAGLYDYGVVLVAIGLRGTAGLPTAIWLMITRTIALLTVATGAALIRHHMESDRLDQIAGAASRLPWSVAALIAGGFALAGMPLTAQFASRWALIQLVAENDSRWALLLLVGAAGVLMGVVRAGRACFGRLSASPVEREPRSLAWLAMALVLVNVLLGLVPQLLTGPVAAVILPLSTLGP